MTFTARLAQQQGQGEFPGRLPKTFSSNCEANKCFRIQVHLVRDVLLAERNKAKTLLKKRILEHAVLQL